VLFSPHDTIVAIATPPGRGGIGVVRVSGPEAIAIAARLIERNSGAGTKDRLPARRAILSRFASATGVRDQVIVTAFPAPHSYTGDDVVEVSAPAALSFCARSWKAPSPAEQGSPSPASSPCARSSTVASI
jgi:tRNA U34 5-carboxymethylaminomethyl modifying GTPase MnmE/TrmE